MGPETPFPLPMTASPPWPNPSNGPLTSSGFSFPEFNNSHRRVICPSQANRYLQKKYLLPQLRLRIFYLRILLKIQKTITAWIAYKYSQQGARGRGRPPKLWNSHRKHFRAISLCREKHSIRGRCHHLPEEDSQFQDGGGPKGWHSGREWHLNHRPATCFPNSCPSFLTIRPRFMFKVAVCSASATYPTVPASLAARSNHVTQVWPIRHKRGLLEKEARQTFACPSPGLPALNITDFWRERWLTWKHEGNNTRERAKRIIKTPTLTSTSCWTHACSHVLADFVTEPN